MSGIGHEMTSILPPPYNSLEYVLIRMFDTNSCQCQRYLSPSHQGRWQEWGVTKCHPDADSDLWPRNCGWTCVNVYYTPDPVASIQSSCVCLWLSASREWPFLHTHCLSLTEQRYTLFSIIYTWQVTGLLRNIVMMSILFVKWMLILDVITAGRK